MYLFLKFGVYSKPINMARTSFKNENVVALRCRDLAKTLANKKVSPKLLLAIIFAEEIQPVEDVMFFKKGEIYRSDRLGEWAPLHVFKVVKK